MTVQALPFLRSPPFPWVAEEIAAVSRPATSAGARGIADPAGLRALIASARVGGAFWSGRDDPWGRAAPVTTHPGDDAAVVAWAAGRTVTGDDGAPCAGDVLADAALDRLAAATYRDPWTGRTIDAAAAVVILGDWRRMIDANRAIGSVVGMAAWKRDAIAQFLWSGTGGPRFRSPAAALARGDGAIAYWPSRVATDFADIAARQGREAWVVEDGFLRSNGLGAECRPPMSIVVDRTGGTYFDPARASEIESILATQDFDAALRERARRLRHAIVAGRLGKYGVDPGGGGPVLPTARRIVLAIGQVDDDLSVIRGGAGLAGNAGFLPRVRAEEPDAHIVYRPHPDVVAGLRRGRLADPVASGLVDRVAIGGSLLDLVERADSVHVLSSLTGFEALLRKREVVVHGSPFYAGWGLTRDLAPQPARRGRRLTLDDLVAGALILAPRYRDPVTLLPCPPEILVERLVATPSPDRTMLSGIRKAIGATRAGLGSIGAAR